MKVMFSELGECVVYAVVFIFICTYFNSILQIVTG